MTTTPFCDIPIGRAAKAGRARRPAWVLVASILASSLAFVDGSVVNVGLPAIGRVLRGDGEALQWVINAYLLPLSALLLLGGALGDRFGRRRLLLIGIVLFAVSSAACAAANDLVALWIARAVQGAGAALVLPNSLAVLGGAYEGEGRGRAVGIWAAASAMSSAIGPLIGGWLIDVASWRWVFLINLPLAAAAALIVAAAVPESHAEAGRPLDRTGAVLASAALALMVWALTVGAGPHGWTAGPIAAAVLGLVLALAFVRTEAQRGDRAMTPPALFGSRAAIGLNLMTFLLYGALSGYLLLLPYALITAGGYPAAAAGAALAPFPVVMCIAGPVMGSLAGRFGSRLLLTIGPLLAGVGFLLAVRAGAPRSYWTDVLPSVLVMAVGLSASAAPLTTAVLSSVDEDHEGAASGLNSAVSRTGGLATTALLGGALAATRAAFPADFAAAAIVGAVISAAAGACAFVGLRKPPTGEQP